MDFGEKLSIEDFRKRYNVKISSIQIRGREFQFYVPATIDEFINEDDVMKDFPLWAKIWEPCIVLAHEISGINPDGISHILEVGCGLGVVGIIASCFGHNVTMTEYDPHAINFARANAVLNLGSDKERIDIVRLDWRSPELEHRFDIITGSEIIYREEDFPYILSLFKDYLKPEGKIILTSGIRKTIIKFLDELNKYFNVRVKKMTLRSSEKEIPLFIIYGSFD